MKINKMMNDKQLIFNIDVYFDIISTVDATDVIQITNEKDEIVDQDAYEDYMAFIETLEEILHFYDFYFTVASTNSLTSTYYRIARNTEINGGDVPYYIRLRVSDHAQKLSPAGERIMSLKDRKNAEELKLPKTKKEQRYKLRYLTVSKEKFKTYEAALNDFESTIRSWLAAKGVDVEAEFGGINEW